MKTNQTNENPSGRNQFRSGGRYAPLLPLKDLYYSQLDSTPVSMDWSTGYTETWEYLEASRCEECGAIVVGPGNMSHAEATEGYEEPSECTGYVPESTGPMMNYYYPLADITPDAPEVMAERLVDLPLCLVHFLESDTYGLALTGGGMDLTWEICEAHMRLGYLPPVHFAGKLPDLCGRGLLGTDGGGKPKMSELDRWIVAGCRKSLQTRKNQAGWALRRLRERFGSNGSKKGGA